MRPFYGQVQSECTFSLVVNLIMTEILTSLLLLAYTTMGLVAVFAFGPTIKDLWQQKTKVNSTTYCLWLIQSVVGCFYALFIVNDLVMLLLSSLYALCCLTVLSLNWRQVRQNRLAVELNVVTDLTMTNENLV